jgi:hypothetical protein
MRVVNKLFCENEDPSNAAQLLLLSQLNLCLLRHPPPLHMPPDSPHHEPKPSQLLTHIHVHLHERSSAAVTTWHNRLWSGLAGAKGRGAAVTAGRYRG